VLPAAAVIIPSGDTLRIGCGRIRDKQVSPLSTASPRGDDKDVVVADSVSREARYAPPATVEILPPEETFRTRRASAMYGCRRRPLVTCWG